MAKPALGRSRNVTLLHISTDPRTLGFLLRQMSFVRSKGWNVETLASPGDYAATVESASFPFHAVRMHPRINPVSDLISIARLLSSIRRIRPLIVHAHTLKAGFLGMLAASLCRVRVRIFHVHGLPHLAATGIRRGLLKSATTVACRLAHRVYCVSPSVRQILVEHRICGEQKVIVPSRGSCDGVDAIESFNPALVEGVEIARFRSGHSIPLEALTVAFIGRLVPHKGLVELSRAWASLRSTYPDVHLLIVGGEESADPLPDDTRDIFRNDPRVHMTGFVANTRLVYAAADIVTLPSWYEGFPTVLLEAAAMKVPVVATAIPGSIDAVEHDLTGTLVPVRAPQLLADAIGRYLQNPELRCLHGDAARKRVVRDFQSRPIWQAIWKDYRSMLQRLGIISTDPEAEIQLAIPGVRPFVDSRHDSVSP